MRWTDLLRPDLAPEAVLALAALGLALLDALVRPRRAGRVPEYLTLAALAAALALSLLAWDPDPLPRDGWLYADLRASLADLLILGGAVLAGALAAGAPGPPGDRTAAGVLTVLSVLGAMIAVSARDLVVLFAGLEITSLSLLARNGLGRGPAARTALGLAVPWAAAAALTLMGIACMWAGAGAPDWDLLARDMGPRSPALTVTGGALLLAGLAVRAGIAPFHFWVPEVAAGCDRPAALLTAAAAVAPALVVAGRLAEALAGARPDLRDLLLGAAILTVTAANLLALPGRRLERLLGYGVVIQAGYAMAAMAAPPGPSPALWLHLAVLIPALAGGLAVSGLVAPGETADGLARRAPLPGAALCVCLIALAGLPPTAAFAARAALFSGLAELPTAAAALLLANSLLTAAVFLRFAARVAFGREPAGAGGALDAGSLSVAVLSAGLLLLAGLWPGPLARAAEAAWLAAGIR